MYNLSGEIVFCQGWIPEFSFRDAITSEPDEYIWRFSSQNGCSASVDSKNNIKSEKVYQFVIFEQKISKFFMWFSC